MTNAVIHGYENGFGTIIVTATLREKRLEVSITDYGVGIADVEQAREPLYTSKPELDRSGMGFTIMENFMDEFSLASEPGKGTTVTMVKIFSQTMTGRDA